MHEAQMHQDNSFITLTYGEECVPRSLNHKHFQDFMKRTRRRFAPARAKYYMAGEYGEQLMRPHFHACLFGYDFHDKQPWAKGPGGEQLFRSPTLEKLWPFGFSSIGRVTFQSAAYVARYVMKKVTGQAAKTWYERVDPETGEIFFLKPEYNRMSLKPDHPGQRGGIGASWLYRFADDIYPHGKVIINGKEANPPRYYDKLYKQTNPKEYLELQEQRELEAWARSYDNTWQRLLTKETVTKARVKQLKRSI